MPATDPALLQLLDLVDEAFDRKAWHGTTLLGSLRGVTPAEAAWRPAPGRHNVWELAVHAAYWKYAVRRRLSGEKRGSFAFRGSNWFERPSRDSSAAEGAPRTTLQRAWTADIRALTSEHRRLRQTIAELPAHALDKRVAGGQVTAGYLVRGIAAHDLYHAGQIQLLKGLHRR
jgi:uncharacterized damage-inducible protein DinB